MAMREAVVTKSYTIDPHSETWRAVKQYIEEQLAMHRRNLGTCGLPMDETENARGAIEALCELQNLAKGPSSLQQFAAFAAGEPDAL